MSRFRIVDKIAKYQNELNRADLELMVVKRNIEELELIAGDGEDSVEDYNNSIKMEVELHKEIQLKEKHDNIVRFIKDLTELLTIEQL